jgi:hypothetical protein
MSNYSSPTRHPVTGAIEMADWLDDHDGKHRYGVRFPSDGKIYGGHECVEVKPREMMDEIERLRAALHEWDALIEHQYSGSREAMSDMTYAAQRTAHLLYGDEHRTWPEPRRAALGEASDDAAT